MVDYSRWDNIDTGTDESSGEAVPAPAHQIISPENHDGPQLCAVEFRLRGTRVNMGLDYLRSPLAATPYPFSSYVGRLRRG
jgi:hypothetical protein